MHGVNCKRRKKKRGVKGEILCDKKRCTWSYKGGKKKCEVDVVSKIERKRETERERRGSWELPQTRTSV